MIKYLIENVLKYDKEEALEKFNIEDIKKYKLNSVLKYIEKPVDVYDGDVRFLIKFAYPDVILPGIEESTINIYKEVLDGKRTTYPKGFFKDARFGKKRALICFEYLCYEILNLQKNEIINYFDCRDGLSKIRDYKLK